MFIPNLTKNFIDTNNDIDILTEGLYLWYSYYLSNHHQATNTTPRNETVSTIKI